MQVSLASVSGASWGVNKSLHDYIFLVGGWAQLLGAMAINNKELVIARHGLAKKEKAVDVCGYSCQRSGVLARGCSDKHY